MIKAINFLLYKKIYTDKNFYVQIFVRLPFALVFPIIFLINFVNAYENNILITVILWSLVSAAVFESFFIVKYEIDSQNDYLIKLTGLNYYLFHLLLNLFIFLFLFAIYLLFFVVLAIFNFINIYVIFNLAGIIAIFLLLISVVVVTQLINCLQIFMKDKMVFNIFNLFMDILLILTGVMFPITLFGDLGLICFLIPFTYPFQIIIDYSLLGLNLEFLTWIISIIGCCLLSATIYKRGLKR